MTKQTWLLILSFVFILDIAFSLVYVPRNKKGDYWKITVFSIIGFIALITGMFVIHKWWQIFNLIAWPAVAYWQLKDSILGLIWHRNLFYMSENHWPDNKLLIVVQNGKSFFIFRILLIIILQGLWKFI